MTLFPIQGPLHVYSTERVREHVIFRTGNCIWFIGEAKLFEPRLERFEMLISEGSEDDAPLVRRRLGSPFRATAR